MASHATTTMPALLQVLPITAEKRALWELLFSDFAQFQDCRNYKAVSGGNGPDFRHKASDIGLW